MRQQITFEHQEYDHATKKLHWVDCAILPIADAHEVEVTVKHLKQNERVRNVRTTPVDM